MFSPSRTEKTVADEDNDKRANALTLLQPSLQGQLAQRAYTNPESVYDELQRAEKWCKEIREKAREQLIKRMGETSGNRLVVDAGDKNINVVRNRPSMNCEVVFKTLTSKGIEPNTVLYRKPIEYAPLPNGLAVLDTMLQSGVISKSEYDAMFEESKYTVTVKRKGAIDAE